MGMYTGVRGKIIVKKMYRDELEYLSQNKYKWVDSNLDIFKKFSNEPISNSIMNDSNYIESMPDSWEYSKEFNNLFNKETGLLTFKFVIKDYHNDIKYFFNKVLSIISKEVLYLESFYEEDEYSTSYKLVDNKIVEDECSFKEYEYFNC